LDARYTTGDRPGPCTCATFMTVDNHPEIYLYGGGLWSSEIQKWTRKYNDLYMFDTEKNIWKYLNKKGDVPSVSTSPATFSIGLCLYVYGGGHNTDTTVSGDMYRFDIVSNVWTKLAPQNIPQNSINERGRDCATANIIGNTVYIYGGNYSFIYGNEKDFCGLILNYKTY